jgi:hypothetical protein
MLSKRSLFVGALLGVVGCSPPAAEERIAALEGRITSLEEKVKKLKEGQRILDLFAAEVSVPALEKAVHQLWAETGKTWQDVLRESRQQ